MFFTLLKKNQDKMETILGEKSQPTHTAASSAHVRQNTTTKRNILVPKHPVLLRDSCRLFHTHFLSISFIHSHTSRRRETALFCLFVSPSKGRGRRHLKTGSTELSHSFTNTHTSTDMQTDRNNYLPAGGSM